MKHMKICSVIEYICLFVGLYRYSRGRNHSHDQALAKWTETNTMSSLKLENSEVWRGLEIRPHKWSKVKVCLAFSPRSLLTREDLPVFYQHLLPDDLPHYLRVDAEQLGDGGVRVVEAVQQNLWHLSLLLPYQPERVIGQPKRSAWPLFPSFFCEHFPLV